MGYREQPLSEKVLLREPPPPAEEREAAAAASSAPWKERGEGYGVFLAHSGKWKEREMAMAF